MTKNIRKYLDSYSNAATLAFFRLAFGLMMLLSLIRFAGYGWIEKFYIRPLFHFKYYGFEWVQPFGDYTYILFIVCGLAAFCVMIGYRYYIAIITFFLSFTYIELLDKTTYLNHYYFISVISFTMIFLPANCCFAVDAQRNPKIAFVKIPSWNIDILKLLLAIVYIYAGLAKINSDWLMYAMPLKIWLPGNTNLLIIGSFLNQNWVHYTFSWAGMLYDLLIVFLLMYRPTRLFAFALVVVFHVLTKILFPIGVFPYVMIVCSLLFFDAGFHEKCLRLISKSLRLGTQVFETGKEKIQHFTPAYKTKMTIIGCFLVFQLLFPFRYLCYPNELFWTEEGFRFSWRVMLMEKAGYTEFTVIDHITKKSTRINNALFLTPFQEKQMAFQPDFILEYAHYLHDYYELQGVNDPEVYAESYVALNGRLSQRFIDPKVDLTREKESFKPKTWILPFNDEIKGL